MGLSENILSMWPYILTFIAVAVFPLALAGYGGHLATLALPEGSSKRLGAIILVWALAIVGVVIFGISQIMTYRSDNQRDREDQTFRKNVLDKLQKIANEPSPAKRQIEAQVLGSAVANIHRPRRSTLTKKEEEPKPPLITDTELVEFPSLSLSGDGSVDDMSPTISVVITALATYEHPSIELNCSDSCVFDSASMEGSAPSSPTFVTVTPSSGLGLLPNSMSLIVTSPSTMEAGDKLTIKLRPSNDKVFFVYGVHPVGK